jgi:hypothetical protein
MSTEQHFDLLVKTASTDPEALTQLLLGIRPRITSTVRNVSVQKEIEGNWLTFDSMLDQYSQYFRQALGGKDLLHILLKLGSSIRALDFMASPAFVYSAKDQSATKDYNFHCGVSVGLTDSSEQVYNGEGIHHISGDIRSPSVIRQASQLAHEYGGFNLITLRPLGGYETMENEPWDQSVPDFINVLTDMYNLSTTHAMFLLQAPRALRQALPHIAETLQHHGIHASNATNFRIFDQLILERSTNSPDTIDDLKEEMYLTHYNQMFTERRDEYNKFAYKVLENL